jgi:hypothetical protein
LLWEFLQEDCFVTADTTYNFEIPLVSQLLPIMYGTDLLDDFLLSAGHTVFSKGYTILKA